MPLLDINVWSYYFFVNKILLTNNIEQIYASNKKFVVLGLIDFINASLKYFEWV